MNLEKELPLDQRYREAEKYSLDLPDQTPKAPVMEMMEDSCPYHKAFHYECCYCNPR